ELKQLRGDFLSVIDEYTNDILENWTIPSAPSGFGGESESSALEHSSLEPKSSSPEIPIKIRKESLDHLDSIADSRETGTLGSTTTDQSSEDVAKSELLQAYYQQL